MTKQSENPVNIFISYRHTDDDKKILDELRRFIDGEVRRVNGRIWVDEDLDTGDFWDEEIKKELEKTDIAIVLVSQSYLGSRYITEVELSSFIERRKQGGLIIMPLILSACFWEHHDWLAATQFLPAGGETIEEHYSEPGKRKRLFLKFTGALLKRIETAKQKKQQALWVPQPVKQVEDSTSMRVSAAATPKRVFIISDFTDMQALAVQMFGNQSENFQVVPDGMEAVDRFLYVLSKDAEPNFPTLEEILARSKPIVVVKLDDAHLSRHTLDEKAVLLRAEIYAKLRLSDSRQLVCLTLGCDVNGKVVTGLQSLIKTLLDGISQ